MGTFVNFVWVTIGENFLSDHISAKKAGKELKPTGSYGYKIIERTVI